MMSKLSTIIWLVVNTGFKVMMSKLRCFMMSKFVGHSEVVQ
jgi:hypothetical protein